MPWDLKARRLIAGRLTMGGAAAMAALFISSAARADTLAFKDGEVLKGRFIALDQGRLVFDAQRFGRLQADPGAVAEVSLETPISIRTTSGDAVLVKGFAPQPAGLRADTRFGSVEVPWADIAQVEAAMGTGDGPTASVAAPAVPREAPRRNEATVSVSQIGNQVSGFAGVSRSHLWTADMTVSSVFGEDTTVSLGAPLYYQSVRVTGLDGGSTASAGGLGDVSLSVAKRIAVPAWLPQVQLKLSAGLPTGRSGGPSDTTLADLSTGAWSLGGQLNVNVPLGGGTLLGAVGLTQYWPRGGGPSTRDLGWAFGYALPLEGNRGLRIGVSGSSISGGGQPSEPAYLNLAIWQELPGGLTVSPVFAHGLTSDSQDYLVGLSVSKAW